MRIAERPRRPDSPDDTPHYGGETETERKQKGVSITIIEI